MLKYTHNKIFQIKKLKPFLLIGYSIFQYLDYIKIRKIFEKFVLFYRLINFKIILSKAI